MTRAFAFLAALAALLIIGCGGGGQLSKEEYTKKLGDVGKTLNSSFSSLSGDSATRDAGALSDKLTDSGKALTDAASDVGDIKPPEEAKAANAKLAEGLRLMGESFKKTAESIRAAKNDPAAMLKAVQGIASSEGLKKFQEAANELQAKGFAVKPN